MYFIENEIISKKEQNCKLLTLFVFNLERLNLENKECLNKIAILIHFLLKIHIYKTHIYPFLNIAFIDYETKDCCSNPP